MTGIFHALRRDRLKQFVRVLRREGLGEAVRRARTHVRMLTGLEAPGVVSEQLGSSTSASPKGFAFVPLWRDLAKARAFQVTRAPAVLSRRRSVAMIGDLNLPQCRKYRVEQLDELWATADIDYRFAHYEDVPRCREILQGATHLMLYRLGRSDLATMYLYEARRLRLPVLYDIDDPLFSLFAYETYSNMDALEPWERAHFAQQAPLYADVMNMADVLSFSTPELRSHAAGYSGRPGFVRRNFADRQTLDAGALARRRARRGLGPTVAVASGSRGHEADLNLILADLIHFLEGGSDRQVMLLGYLDASSIPERLKPQVSTRAFSGYAGYLAALAEADCAVVPLVDDPFNRCKSAVRVIDAAAVGVPVLASDVGDLGTVVQEGETGHVVSSEAWGAALDLVADRSRMEALGRNARKGLEHRWVAKAKAPVIDPDLFDWVAA